MFFSRREFIKSGASVFAVGSSVPAMLMNLAHARAAENDAGTARRVLVVLELNGGNDGLNTVIPINDPQYAIARPTLAIPPSEALLLEKGIALHPSMTAMRDLYKDGRLAVIQGAGYPNADRSHFRSMEIWHRADPGKDVNSGWLGRYWDQAGAKTARGPVPIVHYGQTRPEVFKSPRAPAISIDAVDDFYPMNQKPESVAISSLYKDMRGGSDPAMAGSTDIPSADQVIQSTGQDIVRGTEVIKRVLKNPRTAKVTYPVGSLGKAMEVFAQMIVQDTGTRLIYTNIGGFDTHAKQGPEQAKQLGAVSSAIGAFISDLKAEKRADEVLVMAFSEFGRRVHENASQGTDHGAASIMFFAGGGVKGGLYGQYPSLTDLGDGDLKYNVDFRDCYATVLENWLGTSPDRILPGHPGRVKFLDRA